MCDFWNVTKYRQIIYQIESFFTTNMNSGSLFQNQALFGTNLSPKFYLHKKKIGQFSSNFLDAKLVLGCSEFHEEYKNMSGCQRYGRKRPKNDCFLRGSWSPRASAPTHFSLVVGKTLSTGVSTRWQSPHLGSDDIGAPRR